MTARAFLPLALLVGLTSSAYAEDPQKIAILGLEVTGQTDFASTLAAKNLTTGLRAQVKNNPKFSFAPNSNKELIDEKVANSCDNELVACMSKIAMKLGAQALIYGHIEKKNQAGGEGYQLTLKMLDVKTELATPYTVWIPLADTGGSELDMWAAKAFNNVTGNVAAETPLPDPPKPKPGKPGAGWRITSYVAGGVTLGLAGGFFYYWGDLRKTGNKGFFSYGDKCETPALPNEPEQCKDGSSLRTKTYVTGLGMALTGGVAIYAAYKGFIAAKKESPTPNTTGKSTRKKKQQFSVTPILSPDGAGATVRLDW